MLDSDTTRAQHSPESSDTHHSHLHFSHPLIAESPSPDTKVRLDHFFQRLEGQGTERLNIANLEGEYAFHRSLSVEVGIPFITLSSDGSSRVSNFGNVEVALKAANFAFEHYGMLLGYGLEFGFPTGSDEKGIGSDHILEVEPFLSVGYEAGKIETVVFGKFGIPTNQDEGEEIETEFGYNVCVLYHFGSRVQGLIELDGETVLSGEEDETVANLTTGVKLRPIASSPVFVGLGVTFPLLDDREFDVRTVVSAFYHF